MGGKGNSKPVVSHAEVKELLRRAVLTLASIPDPDLRYRLGAKSGWPVYIREIRDAYGAAPPKYRSFHPTAHDLTMFLELLAMLGWYERDWNAETVKLFRAWVFGAAMWQLQERCSTNRRQTASPNTVHNRINGMVEVIQRRFEKQLSEYPLDELRELEKYDPSSGHGGNSVSDARDLPKPPKYWTASVVSYDEILSAAEKSLARKALEKQLRKNQSRALKRKQA